MQFSIPDIGTHAAKTALTAFLSAVDAAIGTQIRAVYLHGSAAVGDFRPGWSDLDLLILTDAPLSGETANALVSLRQSLAETDAENPFYRAIEGAILPLSAFINDTTAENIVYYGTSGQRITDRFSFNALSRAEWFAHGILLCGEELRGDVSLLPPYENLVDAVEQHLDTVYKYGTTPTASLYSYGWICDIARGLYTLETGKILSKTEALRTALKNPRIPVSLHGVLKETVAVRENAAHAKNDPAVLSRAAERGEEIRLLADALAEKLHAVRASENRCFCGHNCARCDVYLAHATGEARYKERAIAFYRDFSGVSLCDGDLVCHGGREETVMKLCRACPFRACCQRHGVDVCRDCIEYPCDKIAAYEKTCVNRMGQATVADSQAALSRTAAGNP